LRSRSYALGRSCRSSASRFAPAGCAFALSQQGGVGSRRRQWRRDSAAGPKLPDLQTGGQPQAVGRRRSLGGRFGQGAGFGKGAPARFLDQIVGGGRGTRHGGPHWRSSSAPRPHRPSPGCRFLGPGRRRDGTGPSVAVQVEQVPGGREDRLAIGMAVRTGQGQQPLKRTSQLVFRAGPILQHHLASPCEVLVRHEAGFKQPDPAAGPRASWAAFRGISTFDSATSSKPGRAYCCCPRGPRCADRIHRRRDWPLPLNTMLLKEVGDPPLSACFGAASCATPEIQADTAPGSCVDAHHTHPVGKVWSCGGRRTDLGRFSG